jgi:hypothetical protein
MVSTNPRTLTNHEPRRCLIAQPGIPTFEIFAEAAFQVFGIHVEGVGLNIHENRFRARMTDRIGSCNEGVTHRNNGIPWFDANRQQSQMECCSATGNRARVL